MQNEDIRHAVVTAPYYYGTLEKMGRELVNYTNLTYINAS